MHSSSQLPRAVIKSVNHLSSIWLIPIVALIIGAWMVLTTWQQQGQTVTIKFATAQGIEPNKTQVKYRDIAIGKVVGMKLNEQHDGVIVTAKINKNAAELLSQDSQFWVVKPRIGLGNISGLSTIISGAFIEFSPGTSEETASEFSGMDSPPLTPSGTPGLHITLDSNSDQAFQIGDPVLFRGNQAGRIEYVHFNSAERKTYYNVFIDAPYDELITTNTRFWEVKGIEVDLSAAGVKLNTGTLETFINGGVAFDVPTYLPLGEKITERAFFSIYPNKEKVNERVYNVGINYMLQFSQSIRGLKPGAAVEFNGIKVGEVVRTDINYPEVSNFLSKSSLLPVMIKIEPGRVGLNDDQISQDKLQRQMQTWIKQGLHGVLANDNLLTGSKFIDLRYQSEANNELQTFADMLVIPTADGELQQMLSRLTRLVNHFEQLPVTDLLDNFDLALQNVSNAMQAFKKASGKVDKLLQDEQSRAIINQANATLKSVEKLANSYKNGSMTNKQLNQLLQSLTKTVSSLNPLLLQLNLQPSSLIFPTKLKPESEPSVDNNNP